MEKGKYSVVALGELLIDFTENGISGQGNPLLEANPGGRSLQCPCNASEFWTQNSFYRKGWKGFFWRTAAGYHCTIGN